MYGKAGACPCIFDAVSGRFSSDLFNEFLIRHTRPAVRSRRMLDQHGAPSLPRSAGFPVCSPPAVRYARCIDAARSRMIWSSSRRRRRTASGTPCQTPPCIICDGDASTSCPCRTQVPTASTPRHSGSRDKQDPSHGLHDADFPDTTVRCPVVPRTVTGAVRVRRWRGALPRWTSVRQVRRKHVLLSGIILRSWWIAWPYRNLEKTNDRYPSKSCGLGQ